jgi:hypothetical protein
MYITDTQLAAADGSSLVGFSQPSPGVLRTAQDKLREFISIKDYGAVGDDATDDSAAIQAAVDAALAAGKGLYAPAGVYRCGSMISIVNDDWIDAVATLGLFAPGLWIRGDGSGSTIFKSDVDAEGEDFLFKIESSNDHSSFKALLGVVMEGLTIAKGDSAGTGGINFRSCYNIHLRQVNVHGFDTDGINIECDNGDVDGSGWIKLEQVQVLNCGGWGVDCKPGSGHNEISYLNLDNVWIQACGTAAAISAAPTSGGMRWKGQVLSIADSAFTICENVALYLPAESGNPSNATLINTTFENNRKRSLLVNSCFNFVGRNLQMYNNGSNVAEVGMEFYGPAGVIQCVDIDGVFVRATSENNPYTAFKVTKAFSAEANRVRIRNVVWHNFGYSGQVRFAGDGIEYDGIPSEAALSFSGSTVTLAPTVRGNRIPYRLAYHAGAGGGAVDSGEWVTLRVRDSGIAVSASGLSNGLYNVYLYDNANVPALLLSTDATASDQSGYRVRSGHAGYAYVGRAAVVGGALATGAAANFCNPLSHPSLGYLWADSGGKVRVNASEPTSDSNGTIVGTQS